MIGSKTVYFSSLAIYVLMISSSTQQLEVLLLKHPTCATVMLTEKVSSLSEINLNYQPKYPITLLTLANSTFLIHNESSIDQFSSSKIFLKNRWKVLKRLFCFNIVIISDQLDFISNALRLYGPNITDYSYIFVIMSENAFNLQNGRRKFRRDVGFRKLYSPLVLITFDGNFKNDFTKASVQVICPLCSNSFQPPPIQLSKTSQHNLTALSLLQHIRLIHKQYNSKSAYWSNALINRIGSRSQVFDTKYHANIESDSLQKHDSNASENGVILGLLINLFNFTLAQETWSESEEGNYSGIYIQPGGDLPSIYIYGRQLIYTNDLEEFFLYCRATEQIPLTGWNFLTTPFDLITWFLISLTCVAFIIVHNGQIDYGLDVFWAVLGLRGTCDWSKSKLLSSMLVVLITLNTGYLSVITSKVIIPNVEPDIETVKDLFRQGFRFIDANVTMNGRTFLDYWSPYLQKVGLNVSDPNNIIVQVDKCTDTHYPECISTWPGLATGLLYLKDKTEAMYKIPVDTRGKCHGVKEPLRKYWVTFYFQGPLAREIYRVHQLFIATGIGTFWNRFTKAGSIRNAHRSGDHTFVGPKKLSFETPILVVFKLYGVFIGVCWLVFLVEVIGEIFSRCSLLCGNNSVIPFVW